MDKAVSPVGNKLELRKLIFWSHDFNDVDYNKIRLKNTPGYLLSFFVMEFILYAIKLHRTYIPTPKITHISIYKLQILH